MKRFISKIIVPNEICGIPMVDKTIKIILSGQLGQELVESIERMLLVGDENGYKEGDYDWYGDNDPSSIKNVDTSIGLEYYNEPQGESIHFTKFVMINNRPDSGFKSCDIPIKDWKRIRRIINEKLDEEKKRHKEIRYRIKKAKNKLDKVTENISYLEGELHNNYLDTDIQ